MMKKYVVLALIATVALFMFPLSYELENDKIIVKGRFVEYQIDENGDLQNVYIIVYPNKRVHIYTYTSDGFTVLDASNVVSTNAEEKNGDVYLSFLYSSGLKKTYHFINGPHYEFYVEFSKETAVTLPSVNLPQHDLVQDNYYVSYYSKNKVVSICRIEKGRLKDNVAYAKRVHVYMGPPKKTFLREVFKDNYDKVISLLNDLHVYGAYDIVFYPFVWFFHWLYEVTGNFGWAIILFTFVVRLVLYPLYHAQTKSMIKMRKIQKDIEYIKKKYKDPQKQQQELMKVYKEKGVNPMSGCLMMLIQLPIFFILWGVIRYFQEEFAFGKPFLLWHDLSAGGWKANALLVLITIVASFFTTLITSQDSRSAWQGIIMSAVFPLLFISLPSGLFLYYTTNTLIQLVITYYIYKRYKIKGITVRELLGLPKKA
ncbi:MAG: YidC/Oxa1 family membrane protein insertase [Thermotogaceae bacterium]|nr:YidC/Oxa1 family membrane protein insertase [Thermotogaceae bacterium]